MATPIIEPASVTGEVAPALFGRVDLERMHSAAATMRNMFVRFTGGAYSRGGTVFVNYSKQTGRNYPPRLVPFQYSINQGLVLEFGHYYMRVIYQGAMVAEHSNVVVGATQTNPLTVTINSNGALSATPNVGAVTASYATGDLITLGGGTFTTMAQLLVSTTGLVSVSPSVSPTSLSTPSGYAPGDFVTLSGGTFSTAAIVQITNTQVSSATLVNGGTSGTDGFQVVTGTTGIGTKFKANVVISGGIITSVQSLNILGNYTVNPTNLASEPVTGAGLAGAILSVTMAPNYVSVTTAGSYTVNAPVGNFGQASTTGAGIGAAFTYGIFAPATVSVATPGTYTVFPPNPVNQHDTTGSGAGVTFNVTWASNRAYGIGNWINFTSVGGMTQLNGLTLVVSGGSGGVYNFNDVFGNPVDATSWSAYTSGGISLRIYTLTTPWAEQDLKWLKFRESADVISLTCVNQDSNVEYAPYDLSRIADNSWELTQVIMEPTIYPPFNCTLSATPMPVDTTYDSAAWYQYVVTSISSDDASESLPSPIGNLQNAVDITVTAGTVTVTWPSVPTVSQYNVYKATPAVSGSKSGGHTPPPVGASFGYAGSAYGCQFLDSNIIADFAQGPPLHLDPFARGIVTGANLITPGHNYTTATATITTSTGTEASLQCVLVREQVVAVIVQNPGRNYSATDTVAITGDGSGATFSLSIGPQSGTYPSVVDYYQQRRVYGNSLNNPDTYWMSQPGSFLNFDTRIPTIPSDAITGTPAAQQVNGLQFFVAMPGGLVVLTGLGAWQLTGTGGSSLNPQPITPSSQQAQPQAFNGCSSSVPPIKIDYDILYVQAKGSIYRDLTYQFFTNIYTGADITVSSQHLFMGYTIQEHTWCEEPYKMIWSIRNDGTLLGLTYMKTQNVQGWSRHDTNGLFMSVASITEPPVDAAYFVVQRLIGGQSAYFLERMDDRIWPTVEDVWAVDCGLSLAQPTPDAILNVSSPNGVGSLTGVTGLIGGSGYSPSTYAYVVDNNGQGPGSGAVSVLTINGAGVITAVSFSPAGTGYIAPALVIVDPADMGLGASAIITLNSAATFTASPGVFSSGSVGSVIRAAGGIATVTGYTSASVVTGQLTQPISQIQPNSGGLVPAQASGTWTLTAPVSAVTAPHLAGATVTGLADGNVISPRQVSATGVITLDAPATSIVVGLGFQAQWQSVYLDAGTPTIQGQRKKIAAATVRVEASKGIKVGSNQVDGSTTSPITLAPTWINLESAPDLGVAAFSGQTTPLYTGDIRVLVQGGFGKPGQVALQQDDPLPMNILAVILEALEGDEPDQNIKPRDKKDKRK